jgi:hypothetical protein
MVTYHPDSPFRMCGGLLDEASQIVDSLLNPFDALALHVRIYMPLKHPYPHLYTHRLRFGPRVAHWPEATHVCIVRAPVPPPHTHVPAPPPTLTCPTPHLSCLMYNASAVSSLKRQAWGISQALCALFPHPTPNVSLLPDSASMQTQAAGHR